MKGFIKKYSAPILLWTLPILAWADDAAGPRPARQPSGATSPPGSGIVSAQGILDSFCVIFDWAFYFLIAAAVIFGVIGAFRYLTSSGESEKIKSANNTLLYAAIAVGVALLARAIPLIVANFLGVKTSASGLGTC
jgi:hypothetical protein